MGLAEICPKLILDTLHNTLKTEGLQKWGLQPTGNKASCKHTFLCTAQHIQTNRLNENGLHYRTGALRQPSVPSGICVPCVPPKQDLESYLRLELDNARRAVCPEARTIH